MLRFFAGMGYLLIAAILVITGAFIATVVSAMGAVLGTILTLLGIIGLVAYCIKEYNEYDDSTNGS